MENEWKEKLKLTVATLSTFSTCYLLTYCRSSADSTKLKCYDCLRQPINNPCSKPD